MDIYVAQLQDAIPLSSITNIPATSTSVRKLGISGRNFTRLTEVEVNSVPILDGWEYVSDTYIIVPLPTILQTAEIIEVSAFSDSVHDTESSRVVNRIGSGTSVRGIQYVIQLLLKWLFTTQNSCAFHPQGGGGWRKALGYTDYDGTGNTTISELVDGLNRSVDFIKRIQAEEPSLPLAETLASAEIISTARTQRGVRVSILVKSVAEDSHLVAVRAA